MTYKEESEINSKKGEIRRQDDFEIDEPRGADFLRLDLENDIGMSDGANNVVKSLLERRASVIKPGSDNSRELEADTLVNILTRRSSIINLAKKRQKENIDTDLEGVLPKLFNEDIPPKSAQRSTELGRDHSI